MNLGPSVALTTIALVLTPAAQAATISETIQAGRAAADNLEIALIDPVESGADRWGVFEGFEIGSDGFVGGFELPGSYAAAGRALLRAYRMGGDLEYFDEAEAVAAYLLDNQNRAVTYLTDWGFAPGGVLVVEGGNPTFYTAHQARVALFLVEMYGETLDSSYLDAASDIAAFASAELLSEEAGTPNEGGYVYTQDISRLLWPWMFVVGYSEAEMACALSRLEPHGLRSEDWPELLTVGEHLDTLQQDPDGGLYWTNRDVDRTPLGTDARASIASMPLRESGRWVAGREATDWLEVQQAVDGGFFSPHPVLSSSDLTRENAYAIRALVDAGYDPDAGVLDLATDWLVGAQFLDGSFPKVLGDLEGDDDATSAAALALSSCLGLVCTVDPALDPGETVAPGETVWATVTLRNNGPGPITVDLWHDIVRPGGTVVERPPEAVTLGSRRSRTRLLSETIPWVAPEGEHVVRGYCGAASPLEVIDRDSFRFQVVAP